MGALLLASLVVIRVRAAQVWPPPPPPSPARDDKPQGGGEGVPAILAVPSGLVRASDLLHGNNDTRTDRIGVTRSSRQDTACAVITVGRRARLKGDAQAVASGGDGGGGGG